MLNKIKKLPRIYRIIIGLVILVGGVSAALLLTMPGNAKESSVIIEPKIEPAPEPVVYYSPLSGVEVTEAESTRPLTGVMIENSTSARPQSGLDKAGIIYEAIAEGGITRFLAIFQEGRPAELGPVRSARPYYVHWLAPYKASYAHVGGSDDGLAAAGAYLTKDIDQFRAGGSYYRLSSRSAPHNMYTNFDLLDELNEARGNKYDEFPTWKRKPAAPSPTPQAKSISMSVSSANFNPNYAYDAASNKYLRSHNTTPHKDASGSQYAPDVVIAMAVPNASGAKYWEYQNIGAGKAWVFQDGNVAEVQWAKAGITDPIIFTDTAGQEVQLNPGQTWVTAVKSVTWQ